MSRPTNRGQSNFSLDNTPDDAVIRQTKAEPRRMTPTELRSEEGEYWCPTCRAVWFKKAWHNDERKYTVLSQNPVLSRTCPACHKTAHDLPEGIATLSALDLLPVARKGELLQLVRNVGARARKRDPMDRIIRIMDKGNEVQVYTSENQLAVAIGNETKRAFGGDLNVDFSHRDNEIARVVWIAKST